MARTTRVVLIDDLDGSSADETVRFGLDGVEYEIDLTRANAARLRKALEPYIGGARRTGGRKVTRSGGSSGGRAGARRVRVRPSKSGRDIPAIRAWAKEQGLLASERGRIPAEVLAAYDAAH